MALIDEYKQAIQDVLDGRAKEAPRPSELPWSEDKAATMWAAAAAELIAEANAGDALPDTPGTDGTYALQNTVSSGEGTLSWASGGGGSGSVIKVTVDTTGTNPVGKTANELLTALNGGSVVYGVTDGQVYYLANVAVDEYSAAANFFLMDMFGSISTAAFFAEDGDSPLYIMGG